MLSRRLLRIKVFKALYSHHISQRSSIDKSLAEYRQSVDKCYDLYLLLLLLPPAVARYAEGRMAIASQKMRPSESDLNPNRRFVDNRIVAQLDDLNSLRIAVNDRQVSLGADDEEVIKDIYNEMIATRFYESYMSGAISDRAFIEKFYEELFEDNEKFEDYIESLSIFWADDLNFALIQVLRTIKPTPIELLPQWRDDEDRVFGEQLLISSIKDIDKNMALIDSLANNWDLERIAISDKLLLVLAIAEFEHCPSIPIKVTMDETIEISKYFSTAQSGAFINGVLNKAHDQLSGEGKIIKKGRGLVNETEEKLIKK
ncbi:MAG: transcription antitermination factor NusB [Mucinivorans sp.]